MFLDLVHIHGIDLPASTHVGDSDRDRDAAAAAGRALRARRGFLRLVNAQADGARPDAAAGATSRLEARGSVKRTLVPRPASLSIRSSPPWARTRCLTMARP